jgi:preprotein translocase subunit SecY
MKAFINTIKNINKIEELRSRILYTLGILLIYRFGAHVTLPGINPNLLEGLQKQTQDGVMGLLDMFSGGAFSNASVFALGIMPYISASIIVQLLGIGIPYFQRLQREGESGRRKMNQITRYLTVVILMVQAPSYLANLHAQIPAAAFVMKGAFYQISSVIILTAGTMFVMWLGERITDKGIGNGISLIIMIGIIARLPVSFGFEIDQRLGNSQGGMIALLFEIIILFAVFL